MARIKTYAIDTLISDNDIVIGSDNDNFDQTKNYQVSALREYVLSGLDPETGGNLKITTIVDNDSEETTPEDYFNNSETPIIVLHYEIVFLILNGRTFIFRKNNDTYGIDETQVVSSDFTEIDITSVINANRQDLDSVLSEGNESFDNNVFINKVYLWDNVDNTDYGCAIEGSKEALNVYKASGSFIGSISDKEIKMKSGIYSYNVIYPSITANRNATLQNASGTIAYLSDIPSDYITDVTSGSDEITVTNTDGEVEITYNEQKDVILLKTYLINPHTDTIYYGDGGVFSFDEETEPINAIDFYFEEGIVSNSPDNFGYVAFHYKNGDNAIYTIPLTGHSISGDNLRVKFPLIDYWSADLSYFSIHLLVGCISSSTSGKSFNGITPSSITNYYNV
jgi:hypothetical protein